MEISTGGGGGGLMADENVDHSSRDVKWEHVAWRCILYLHHDTFSHKRPPLSNKHSLHNLLSCGAVVIYRILLQPLVCFDVIMVLLPLVILLACVVVPAIPPDTVRWPNAVLMLGQRRRRWTNIETTSGFCWLGYCCGLTFSKLNLLLSSSSTTNREYLS